MQRDESDAGAPPVEAPRPAGGNLAPGGAGADPSIQPAAPVDPIDRIREIVGLEEGQGNAWVGPMDEYEVADLWNSLGPGLPSAVVANRTLWDRSIDRGMEPEDIPLVRGYRETFEADVQAARADYLKRNDDAVAAAQSQLGLDKAGPVTADQQRAREDLEFKAVQANQLMKAKERIERTQVGWRLDTVTDPEGGATTQWLPVHFDPKTRPESTSSTNPSTGEAPDTPVVSWEEVAGQWDPVSGALTSLLDEHPALYAATASGDLGKLAGETADNDPIGAARSALDRIRASITDSRNDPVAWQELTPIHDQLFRAERKGTVDWSHPLYRAVGQEMLDEHGTKKQAVEITLGLLAATAFILAEVGTGGAATLAGAALIGAGTGVGVGTAAAKWKNWDELRAAAGAAANSRQALVGQGQVDDAFVEAIIQTAFVALDAWQAGKALAAAAPELAAAGAGAKAAAIALKQLPAAGAERIAVLTKGLNEFGVERVLRETGISDAATLAREFDAGSAEAARVLAYAESAAAIGAVDVEQQLAKIAAGKGAAEGIAAEQVVAVAIERIGPGRTVQQAGGWKLLASTLGPESAAGAKLNAWRQGIYTDLQAFAREAGAEVTATGSGPQFANDLDMSFLGKDAAANRQNALQFVAGRAHLPANPDVIEKSLYMSLFTDPRRIHMYDKFPAIAEEASRTAARFEERLIWSAELGRVTENPQYAAQVLERMNTLGIRPLEDFEKLSKRAAGWLSHEQDRLVGEIEALANAATADQAAIREKALELAQIQAQINLSEKGGYFSGGGVRRFVSQDAKAPMPGYEAGGAPRSLSAQEYTAATDQIVKIRDEMAKLDEMLPKLVANNAELPGALKGIGKYGDRFSETAKAAGLELKGPSAEAFDEFSTTFASYLEIARGNTLHSMQTLVERNQDLVVTRLREALAKFDEGHVEILADLRRRAGIVGQDAVGDEIISATIARYRWAKLKDSVEAAAVPLARAAEAGTRDQSDRSTAPADRSTAP